MTITGKHFTGATEARFGSTRARSFEVKSETQISAVSPAFGGGEQDAVPVYVTTAEGTNEPDEVGSLKTTGFIYEPTLSKIEPSSGPASGDKSVKITGSAFIGENIYAPPLESLREPVLQYVYFGSTPSQERQHRLAHRSHRRGSGRNRHG